MTAIAGLIGTAAGAALGNTPADAAQGSLNAKNAVNNNYNLDDLKDDAQRAAGSLVGVALSGLSMFEPILKPRETANGIKAIMNSPNKAQLIQMGIILMVKERSDDYELFTRNNQLFGQGIVIGRSVTDVGLLATGGSGVVKFLARSPRMFEAALQTLKATGRVTINGVNLVYAAGKIMRAPVRPPSRAAIDNAIRRTAATGNGRRVVEEIGIRPNSGTPKHMTQVKPVVGTVDSLGMRRGDNGSSAINRSQAIPIVLRNGYYETAGMKISENYYNRLWQEGRPAPFVQAREILENKPRIFSDSKPGFLRYESLGLELIYNPKTGEIWHIQPQRLKRK